MNGMIHFLTHFLTQYVPFILFTVFLVKQIGMPVSALPLLVAAGVLAGSGQMTLGVTVVVVSVVLAALSGDELWYELVQRRDSKVLNGVYQLYDGLGTTLGMGLGIGLGYAFTGQLEPAVSAVAHVGPTTVLVLLGGVAGYVVYKTLHQYRMGRRVLRLPIQQVTKEISEGKGPILIDLRSHGAVEKFRAFQTQSSLQWKK